MRVPVRPDEAPQADEPSAQFIADVALAIRGGARPEAAAAWRGIPRQTFKRWMRRRGEPYVTLRAQVRAALAHLEVRLQSELAEQHFERALRTLRRHERDDPDASPREYARSGLYSLERVRQHLVERVADPEIAGADLTPIERAVREWRLELVADLGGDVSAARRALLDAVTGSKIVLDSVDAYLLELAQNGGLASRKHRRLYAVVESRMRIADGFCRQLQALGEMGAERARASP